MKKVICLGDSNTYGYDPTSLWGDPYEKPWPAILQDLFCQKEQLRWKERIESAAVAEVLVVNLGRNGRMIPSSSSAIQAVDGLLRSEMPAERMVLYLGTNDVLNLWKPSKDLLRSRYEGYVRHLREAFPETEMILLNPHRVRIIDEVICENQEALHEIVQQTAIHYGLRTFDLTEFDLPLGADGIHLTEEGHRRLAEAVYRI